MGGSDGGRERDVNIYVHISCLLSVCADGRVNVCSVCAGEEDKGVCLHLVCRHFNRMDSERGMSYIICI